MEGESSLTLTGQVLGTPGYMAPEQAKGGGTVGPAADVYGLGALLFHLVTGRAPFVGASAAETLTQVLQQEPLSPRLLNPAVPVDLSAVCLKCLRKAPRERYGSAGELAADLERFLGNETTHARPEGPVERSLRWARRKPALAAAVVALIVVGLTGVTGIVWQWQRAHVEGDHARVIAYEADMNLAQHALAESNLGRAVELLERHRPARGQKDLRGWEWRYLWHRSRSDERATIASLPGGIEALASSPGYNVIAGAETSGSVRFWNSNSWQEIDRLNSGATLRSMALSPDGELVALGTLENEVMVWDWRQKHQTARFSMAHGDFHGERLAFSPDGSSLVAGDEHGFIEVRGTKDFNQIRRWAAHENLIRAVAFSRDGRRLASGGDDQSVKIWDTATWELRKTIPAPVHQPVVMGLQFSADGKELLTCGADSLIKLWDVITGQQIATFSGHGAHVYAVVLSPDGSLVASASGDQTIRIWDRATQKQIARLQGHGDEVGALAFSQDGKTLVSGSKDGLIKLWDVPQQRDDPTFLGAPEGVFAGDFSRDGRFFVTYSPAGIGGWSAQERKQLGLIPFADDKSLADGPFAINGGMLAFRWLGGAVRIFNLMPFQEANLLPSPSSDSERTNSVLAQLALSDDGKLLAAGSVAGEAEVQDWSRRQSLAHWTMRANPSSLLFAPDGRFLASGHVDGTVRFWEVETGVCLATLKAHQRRVDALAFSRDGRLLATGGGDSVIKVWAWSSQQLLATLHLYRSSVQRLAFTPDGTRLATTTEDGSIKFWDLDTGQEVLTLKAHPTKTCFAFTSGGEILVSGSVDGIRFWRAPAIAETENLRANAAFK
jgi:WD40 repeat protein